MATVTAMKGLKLHPKLVRGLGIDELIKVKQRSDLTISSSPFSSLSITSVMEGTGNVFIKGAPAVKGLTYDQMRGGPDGVYDKIRAGLDKAIAISKGKAGVTGVAIVMADGKIGVMPAKSAEQMQEGLVGRSLGPKLRVRVISRIPSKSYLRKRAVPAPPPRPPRRRRGEEEEIYY